MRTRNMNFTKTQIICSLIDEIFPAGIVEFVAWFIMGLVIKATPGGLKLQCIPIAIFSSRLYFAKSAVGE